MPAPNFANSSAVLWVPTGDLPASRPHGLLCSPDGDTLYVTCAGTGSDGALVSIDIASKAITTLESGLTYPKQGIAFDAAGDVYYATGGQRSSSLSTLWRWDGSTSTSVLTAYGIFGHTIANEGGVDYLYYVYHLGPGAPQAPRHRKQRLSDLAVIWDGVAEADFTHSGGFTVAGDNVIICRRQFARARDISDGSSVDTLNDSDTVGQNGAFQAAVALSATRVIFLTDWGEVVEWDPTTDTSVDYISEAPFPLHSNLNVLNPEGPYGGLAINDFGDAFAAQGWWTGFNLNNPPQDGQRNGEDVGIYRLIGNRGGWHIGTAAVRIG